METPTHLETHICPTCRGARYILHMMLTCDTCHGEGIVQEVVAGPALLTKAPTPELTKKLRHLLGR